MLRSLAHSTAVAPPGGSDHNGNGNSTFHVQSIQGRIEWWRSSKFRQPQTRTRIMDALLFLLRVARQARRHNNHHNLRHRSQ
jgi:hypothetical protein